MPSKNLTDDEKRILVGQYVMDGGIRRNDIKKLRSLLVDVGVRCLKSDETLKFGIDHICKNLSSRVGRRDSTLRHVDEHLLKIHQLYHPSAKKTVGGASMSISPRGTDNTNEPSPQGQSTPLNADPAAADTPSLAQSKSLSLRRPNAHNQSHQERSMREHPDALDSPITTTKSEAFDNHVEGGTKQPPLQKMTSFLRRSSPPRATATNHHRNHPLGNSRVLSPPPQMGLQSPKARSPAGTNPTNLQFHRSTSNNVSGDGEVTTPKENTPSTDPDDVEAGDSRPDRLLTLAEFVGFIAALKAEHFAINNQADGDLIEAFVSVGGCEDASGDVSADILRDRFKDVNLAVDIDKLIEEIDEDGSGKVEFDEFTALMTNAQMAATAYVVAEGGAGDTSASFRPKTLGKLTNVVSIVPHPPPPSSQQHRHHNILSSEANSDGEDALNASILLSSSHKLGSNSNNYNNNSTNILSSSLIKATREVLDPFCLFRRLGGDPDVEELSVLSRRTIVARLKDVGLNEYELRNFTYFAERVGTDSVDFATFCSDIVDMVDYGYQRIDAPATLTSHQRKALAIANNGASRRRSAPRDHKHTGAAGSVNMNTGVLRAVNGTTSPTPSEVDRGVDLSDALAVLEGGLKSLNIMKNKNLSEPNNNKQHQQSSSPNNNNNDAAPSKYVYKFGCTFPRQLTHLLMLNYTSLIWFENRAKALKKKMSCTALRILGTISNAIRLLAKHRASCPACYASNAQKRAAQQKRDRANGHSTLHDLPPHYMSQLVNKRNPVDADAAGHHHNTTPWKGGGKRGLVTVRDSFGCPLSEAPPPAQIGGMVLPRIEDVPEGAIASKEAADKVNNNPHAVPVNAATLRATPRYAPEPNLDVLAARVFERNKREKEQQLKYEEKFGRPPPNTCKTNKHYFSHTQPRRVGTADTTTTTRGNNDPTAKQWVPFPTKPSSARSSRGSDTGGMQPHQPHGGLKTGASSASHRRRVTKDSFRRSERDLDDVSNYYWTAAASSSGVVVGGRSHRTDAATGLPPIPNSARRTA